jgi:hypothetical protein
MASIRRRRKRLGAVVTTIGAFLTFISSVSVEQAQTNVASWVHFAGIDRIPAFLASKTADYVLLSLGAIAILGGLLFYLYQVWIILVIDQHMNDWRNFHTDEEVAAYLDSQGGSESRPSK